MITMVTNKNERQLLLPQKKRVALVVLMMMVVVALVAEGAEGLSCARITGLLIPCLGYLERGGLVPRPCCQGVRTVFAASRTAAARRGACSCLKAGAARFPGIRTPNVRILPRRCGLNLPYVISPTTNCNRIR